MATGGGGSVAPDQIGVSVTDKAVVEALASESPPEHIDELKRVTGILEFYVPKTVKQEEMDNFFAEMYSRMQSFVGFLDRQVISHPTENGTTKTTVIIAFTTYQNLRTWLLSDDRVEVLKMAPFLWDAGAKSFKVQKDEEVVEVDGVDLTARKPVAARPPPKWKLALVTFVGVFSAVFSVAEAGIPRVISKGVRHSYCTTTFGVLLCVVPPLVFAVIPMLTRVLGCWLRQPRPVYTSEPMRTLDAGLALFVPAPPAVIPGSVAKLQDRVDHLEETVRRLRSATAKRGRVPTDQLDLEGANMPMPNAGLDDIKAATAEKGSLGKSLPVTGVAHHHVRWEYEQEFLALSAEFRRDQEKQMSGFLGMVTLHGKQAGLAHTQEYVNIWKYATLPDMEACANSDLRRQYLTRLKPLLESPSEIVFQQDRFMHDAFSEMFTNPGEQAPSQPPPVWKTVFLVVLGLMMCVWPVNQNFGPILVDWGVTQNWAVTMILCFINVTLNTWLCVPFLIFMFGYWMMKPRGAPTSVVGRLLDRGLPNIYTQVAVSALYFTVLWVLIGTKALANV